MLDTVINFSFDSLCTLKSSNDRPILQMGKLNPIEIKVTKARWPVGSRVRFQTQVWLIPKSTVLSIKIKRTSS